MGDGYKTPLSFPVHLPCWFIISVIQLRLLYMWIPLNKLTSVLLITGSFTFLLLRKILGFDLYFCLDSTIMAIPYFIIGHYWAKNKIIEIADKYKLLLIPFCVILLCIILVYNGPSQMNGPSYGKNILLNYIAGLTGTIMVFMLSQFFANKCGNKEYIHTISRNTLFIIFFHWVLLIPCGIIAKKIPAFCVNDVFIVFMMPIFISIIILHFSKLMIYYNANKYPILFGKHGNINK